MEFVEVDERIEEVEFDIVVRPYQFEPVESDSDEEIVSGSDYGDGDDDDNEPGIPDVNIDRIGNADWCHCGNCTAMPTGQESVCCQEMAQLERKLEEDPHTCIIIHDGFIGNCLNRHVIETSIYEFVGLNGPLDDNVPAHRTYRYIAYRRFTRWIWHILGKLNRKTLPSCAVHAIRTAFPSDMYTGFKYALPH